MRVTVLGGGGFRTPLVWESVARVAEEAGVDELMLHDVSAARLTRIAAVVEGLRREHHGGPAVRTTTNLRAAAEGAGIVFCAIRVGGLEGRVIDETVPLREGVMGQETVGPGGISFALRTVPVMLAMARAVSEVAPTSWFLNFTNPAGLVTEALREVLGDRVVGICDSPEALCARVAAALGRRRSELVFDYAGVNHLGWLLAVRAGGRELLPELLSDDTRLGSVDEARLFGVERLRRLAMVPNEYLVYYEAPGALADAFRRAGATRGEVLLAQQASFYDAGDDEPAAALASWRLARDARFGTYMAEAWASAPPRPLDASVRGTGAPASDGPAPNDPLEDGPGAAGYAAIAAAFLRALCGPAGATLVLNVANRGALPGLDDDAVVEVPCTVTPAGPRAGAVGALPPAQADLVARVKEVERLTLRAALEGSRALALRALAAHPVVPSHDVAERILDGYLAAFPDLARRLE